MQVKQGSARVKPSLQAFQKIPFWDKIPVFYT